MTLPKITVITPSYNQGKYIRDTIESVLSQDYPNLEYIVMDGGSTDETIKILKSYGDKLTFVSKKDKGQTDAINKGLTLATGEVLAYLNSDDVYLPGALRRVGEYYAGTKADWITGDCIVINESGKPTHGGALVRGYKRFLMALYSQTTLMLADNMLPQPSTFWSRRAYKKVGNFDDKLEYVMDYDYWLRLAHYYRPHDLRVALSAFRAQPDSKSETSRDKMIKEGNQVLMRHGAKPWHLILHRAHSNIVRLIYNLLK